MLNSYSDLEKKFTEKVTSIVVFSGGGVSYEDVWSMSHSQLEALDDSVNDKIKLMTSTGRMF